MKSAGLLLMLFLFLLISCVAVPAPAPFSSPLGGPDMLLYLPVIKTDLNYGRGVGLTYGICNDVQIIRARWYINWGTVTGSCATAIHVPVVWGTFSECPVTGPGPLTLGFNEPQRADQANLTPTEAAVLWHKLTIECASQRLWATPSAINDLYWLTDWYNAYITMYGIAPRADLVNVHCYSWSGADACIAYLRQVQDWARARNIPGVIISEWAILPCSLGETQAIVEAEKVQAWMETQPNIVGAAWFAARIYGNEEWILPPGGPACNTTLVDTSGALTAFGQWYSNW